MDKWVCCACVCACMRGYESKIVATLMVYKVAKLSSVTSRYTFCIYKRK